jgi:cytochrome c-type biogenesis protein CcmH/NrfG
MMNRKQIQRLLIVIFGLAFVGSTAFALIDSLFASRNTTATNEAATTEETSATEQLKAQAQGYAKVLEREPENTTALTGLLQTSLQMGDLKSAIAPLKKLTKLYPDNTELKDLLTKIETELAKQPAPTKTEAHNKQP